MNPNGKNWVHVIFYKDYDVIKLVGSKGPQYLPKNYFRRLTISQDESARKKWGYVLLMASA